MRAWESAREFGNYNAQSIDAYVLAIASSVASYVLDWSWVGIHIHVNQWDIGS